MAPTYYYVDNTSGSDNNMGNSPNDAYLTLDEAIDSMNNFGGDGIRIMYTGQDYTYTSGRSYIGATGDNGLECVGSGWGEGEYKVYEGYDHAGLGRRPRLIPPEGALTGYSLQFSGYASYWLIRDIHFAYTHINTTWSSAHVNLASGMADGSVYFRFRRCIFEGVYSDAGAALCRGHGIHVSGGAYYHVDTKYNYFKDLYIPYRMNTSSPQPIGAKFMYNVIFNTYHAGTNYFVCDSAGLPVDMTVSYNTCLSIGPSQYNGNFFYTNVGAYDTTQPYVKFESKNNFAFWINYGWRSVAPATVTSDVSNYMGYNTWGRVNSTDRGYYGGFDYAEVDPVNYTAVGDNKIHSYSQADITGVLVNPADTSTFWWPEAKMFIPDLRPSGWEMTGTWEDPVDGLRGAIQYSGDYKETTISTLNSVRIEPRLEAQEHLNPNFFDPPLLEPDATNDYQPVFGSSFTSYTAYTFGTHLLNGDVAEHVVNTVSLVGGSYRVSSYVRGVVYPGAVQNTNIMARVQLRSTGPEDSTGDWSGWVVGNRTNQVQAGTLTGTHTIAARVWDSEDDSVSDWTSIYSYVI